MKSSEIRQQFLQFFKSKGPVSYTHLDVYKRQEPLRVICVFNPPLTGQEVHDKEGVYALPEAQAQAA